MLAAKQFSLPNCMAAANQFSLLNRVVDCESVLLPTSIIGSLVEMTQMLVTILLYDGVKCGTLECERMNF